MSPVRWSPFSSSWSEKSLADEKLLLAFRRREGRFADAEIYSTKSSDGRVFTLKNPFGGRETIRRRRDGDEYLHGPTQPFPAFILEDFNCTGVGLPA